MLFFVQYKRPKKKLVYVINTFFFLRQIITTTMAFSKQGSKNVKETSLARNARLKNDKKIKKVQWRSRKCARPIRASEISAKWVGPPRQWITKAGSTLVQCSSNRQTWKSIPSIKAHSHLTPAITLYHSSHKISSNLSANKYLHWSFPTSLHSPFQSNKNRHPADLSLNSFFRVLTFSLIGFNRSFLKIIILPLDFWVLIVHAGL